MRSIRRRSYAQDHPGRGLGPFSSGHLTLIIVTLAIVLGLPTIASAVIPNGNTYNACANKKTGALRLIDTSKKQTCKKSTETAVSWSKTGAKGAKGATGPAGTNGTGAPGPSGVVSVATIDGFIGSSVTLSGTFQFLGGTTSVTVASGQNVVGSVNAALGSSGGASAKISLCESTGTPSPLHDYNQVSVDATKRSYTQSRTAALSPGTYTVGFCASGSGTLDTNDVSTGWFMVVTTS